MSIAPLHNHTGYSTLDGESTPEEIAQRCQEIGCSCCGITDHGVVTGHLHFAKAMTAAGIKPIFGCELYHGTKTSFKGRERDQAHLIALAMTDEGLRNLWRLVNCTADQDHFHNVGRVFWHDLEKYREGLVVTSACALGMVPKSIMKGDYEPLNRYLDIFGDNFYIEIHTYPYDKPFTDRDADDQEINMKVINESLVAIAQERGIPLVYANDAHYAFPWQYEYHDLYLALATGDTIFTPVENRKMWHPPEALSIMDEEGVREALSYLPDSVVDEALENSVAIAERAQANLPEVRRHLPVFVPSECPWLDDASKQQTPEMLFIELVEGGIVRKYGEDAAPEVWERVVYEVETLIRDGIHHYFLMGWDEMRAAQEFGVETGPGRGSSAGCIVAYALDITDVDPLHYGLIFERFWNSGRASGFPDIDSDFSRSQRDKMIQYLEERWGSDRVCAIGTTGYMKPKATIDKIHKGFGITYAEADELKKIVGRTTKIDILGHKQIGWNPDLEPGKVYYVKNDVGQEIEEWIKADPRRAELRRTFIRFCEMQCSRPEQYGIHASGIVISDVPLDSELPAYRRGGKDKGKPATMFAMEDVDKRQFVKLDVLGLRTLDVLEFWRQMMKHSHDVDIEWSGLDTQEHPDGMWDLLRDGFTSGIFQVEDGYGRQLCKQIEPRSVEDLSVINALNRPGPIQAGIPDQYIARRRGEEEVTYVHPSVEKILGPILNMTYGLFVYQEQIIAYFNALGYTLSESDAMRKIMGKKQPQDLAAIRDGVGEWEGKGYFDKTRALGIPDDAAESVWHTIEGFADYCFNKSHTVAYAVIGFRTLFAKYYGPGEFYAACLRSLEHSTDGVKRTAMVPQFITECRRMDIDVYPPNIWRSQVYAHVEPNGELRFGFYDVKGVGNSGDFIYELVHDANLSVESPQKFLEDFDEYNKKFLLIKKAMVASGEWDTKVKSPKQRLQANKIDALAEVGAWPASLEKSLTELQEAELEYLGVILTDNTEEVIDRNAEQISMCDSWEELLTPFQTKVDESGDEHDYFQHKVCGIVTDVQEKRSRKTGKAFGIVTIEYGMDQLEFTVFSNKWRSHKFLFRLRQVGIFTLHHTPEGDYPEGYHFVEGFVLK